MVPGLPVRPKDFTLVKHDGLYHLFYIRHNVQLPTNETENDLGHATSPDLWNWTQAPPVLAARPDNWDRSQIWAPSIVQKDSVFYMFYTGVSTIPDTTQLWQRVGVATSTDLLEWTRLDSPVFTCRDVPWSYCDSTTQNSAFRDPFVMPDPAEAGHWLMYYSGCPHSDSVSMLLGMAGSYDLVHWSDLGPLWATNHVNTGNYVVESAHLFPHGSLWYLLYTTYTGSPITIMTGTDPTGPPSTWTNRGGLGAMLGTDTFAWYASEHFSEGLVDYLAYVIADRIDVKRIQWGADWKFSLVQPDLMHVKSMVWDSTSVADGDSATLSIVSVNWGAAPARLEAVRVRSDGSQVVIPVASLGLPATVTLTGPTTSVRWVSRWLPDPPDTSRTMRLIVRTIDQTAIATALTVLARPLHVTRMSWDRATVMNDSVATLAVTAEHWGGQSVALEARRERADSTFEALAVDSLGLPGVVMLSGDTTRVAWTARWLRDAAEPADSSRALRLAVRLADSSVTAPVLSVEPTPPLQVRALGWDRDTVADDSVATLAIVAEYWRHRGVVLEARQERADSSMVVVPVDSLGLPAVVMLSGDTTRVAWTARWRADSTALGRGMRLVVRLADSSATAPPLTVLPPPPLEVIAMWWDSASVRDGNTTTLSIRALHWKQRSALLEGLRVVDDTTRTPIALASLGLPAAVALSGDTTRVPWTARWVPDPADSAHALWLLVRLADSTVAAPRLLVLGPFQPPLAVGDGGPALRNGLQARPRGVSWSLVVQLDRRAEARLELFDLQGRRIRRLLGQELPPGTTVVPWDGRDGNGGAVASGIYFARLAAPHFRTTVRLVYLR
jgi:hypothetical protein